MTREQELMARAMNYIDDDMILAAHGPRKRLRRTLPGLVAACLAVTVVLTFPYLRQAVKSETSDGAMNAVPGAPGEAVGGDNMNNDGVMADGVNSLFTRPNPAPEISIPSVGSTLTLGGTTVTVEALSDTTVTFHIVKGDSEPIHAAFFQYGAGVLASTEEDFRDNGTILRPYTVKLHISGDDTVFYQFPTAAGTYEIVVDFSSLRKGDYRMDEIMALYRYPAGETRPEAVYISLHIAEESETVGESE